MKPCVASPAKRLRYPNRPSFCCRMQIPKFPTRIKACFYVTPNQAHPRLASIPGPHRHRIYDRREEGLVKLPFCFASLPTIVGKISTWNIEPRVSVFKSAFDSQNPALSPGCVSVQLAKKFEGERKRKPLTSWPFDAWARMRQNSVAKPFPPICVLLDLCFPYFSLVLRILTPFFHNKQTNSEKLLTQH